MKFPSSWIIVQHALAILPAPTADHYGPKPYQIGPREFGESRALDALKRRNNRRRARKARKGTKR